MLWAPCANTNLQHKELPRYFSLLSKAKINDLTSLNEQLGKKA